jgi:hypothetical protein
VNSRTRISFLSTFFVGLTVLFAVAVAMRIRAYSRSQPVASVSRASLDVPASATDGGRAVRTADVPATYTLREVVTNRSMASASSASQAAGTPRVAMPHGTSTREQRFKEALAAAQKESMPAQPPVAVTPRPAPPPVVKAVKPVEKPSLLNRIGSAISSAFSGNSPAKSTQSTSSQQQLKPNQRDDPGSADKGRPKEKDATSDTTAPRLLGVEFNPPQINDGQETAIIITATDDMSGIRNISGSVSSPQGKALQGFAAQRESPESNRYVARLAVPKDAEEGNWKINFLSLTDNANNSQNLNFNQGGGATFRVISNRPDSTPPTLRAVYLQNHAMQGGEKNTVFVQAADDKSGVAIVSGVFQSPNHTARIGFGCRATGVDQFECDLVPPKTVDCGAWSLEQIQLQDRAQNMATVRGDNPIISQVQVNITAASCDSTPPVVQNVTVDPVEVSNKDTSVVTVTATVTDDISGVQNLSGQAASPPNDEGQPQKIFFAFQPGPDPQTWIGRIAIPALSAKGTWQIMWLQAQDKSSNLKTYSQSDAALANAKFTVH